MSRWPAVTGLWLGTGAWVYAVLSVLELRTLDHDPVDDGRMSEYVLVAAYVPPLAYAVAVVLGPLLLLAAVSLATGRARRVADALLALGLLAGGWFLWGVEQPRPTAPVVVALAALPLALSVLLPLREHSSQRSFPARLLLMLAAVLGGWVCVLMIADYRWQLQATSSFYFLGAALSVLMAGVAAVLPLLTHPAWRWVIGLPTLLAGLFLAVGGVLGLRSGFLVSDLAEIEDGWVLGGPVLYAGLGLAAGGLAALRDRWALAAGTVGAAVLVLLGIVFGVPEIRNYF